MRSRTRAIISPISIKAASRLTVATSARIPHCRPVGQTSRTALLRNADRTKVKTFRFLGTPCVVRALHFDVFRQPQSRNGFLRNQSGSAGCSQHLLALSTTSMRQTKLGGRGGEWNEKCTWPGCTQEIQEVFLSSICASLRSRLASGKNKSH